MSLHDIVLAIDQGTTNTKVLAVDRAGSVVGRATTSTPVSFPRPGWVESDASAIWHGTLQAIDLCVSRLANCRVVAVAVSNQRETTVLWDAATGEPIGPAVSWQCLRAAPWCDDYRLRGHDTRVRAITGLELSPMFAAGKMAWLLDQQPGVRARAARGEVCIGTIDSWLLWKLTRGERFATDHTNASRTLLLDLESLTWARELVDLFEIPLAALAAVQASASHYGTARLPDGTEAPVLSMVGDSHAALVGQGLLGTGGVKASFGTGTSVLAPVAHRVSSESLAETIAWSRCSDHDDRTVRALEGNISSTGAALDLTAAMLGVADVGELAELAADGRAAAHGLYFVPALSGLGAPHWDDHARGLMIGLTRGTSRNDVARAAFEAVAFQVRDVLAALPAECRDGDLCVDGGAIRSDFLAGLVADITEMRVVRPEVYDMSALGAAYLAGVQAGVWPDLQSIDQIRPASTVFEPRPMASPSAVLRRWDHAVDRSRGWADCRAALLEEPGR